MNAVNLLPAHRLRHRRLRHHARVWLYVVAIHSVLVIAGGAAAVVDGKAADTVEQIKTLTKGGAWAVIDLVGNAKTAQLGFDCLTKGGKLVMVGLFGGGAPWALPLIPIKAITIQGSYVGNLRETQELLDLVRTKKIEPIPVTPMPLAKANEALVDLQKGRLVGRAVLTP